jgi:ABC-type branched-subunit amino acid transport system ATPase component
LDLYDQLTVAENARVGSNITRGHHDESERVEELLSDLGLTPVAETLVCDLSQGQRQLVSIARALAGDPLLVLLDEPAAGLASPESAWLGRHLETIRRRGTTILLVEHDMALVTSVCDEVYVLDFGQVISHGTPAEIRSSPEVVAAYLGTPEVRSPLGTEAPRHVETSP